MSLLLEEDLLL